MVVELGSYFDFDPAEGVSDSEWSYEGIRIPATVSSRVLPDINFVNLHEKYRDYTGSGAMELTEYARYVRTVLIPASIFRGRWMDNGHQSEVEAEHVVSKVQQFLRDRFNSGGILEPASD